MTEEITHALEKIAMSIPEVDKGLSRIDTSLEKYQTNWKR